MAGACDANQLQVNGALLAGRAIQATRTHGAAPDSGGYGEFGEQVDLSGSFYMGEYSRASAAASLETVDEVELPPRF
jgi:hypothetical protein